MQRCVVSCAGYFSLYLIALTLGQYLRRRPSNRSNQSVTGSLLMFMLLDNTAVDLASGLQLTCTVSLVVLLLSRLGRLCTN